MCAQVCVFLWLLWWIFELILCKYCQFSPWYNRHGWLGVKNQLSIDLLSVIFGILYEVFWITGMNVLVGIYMLNYRAWMWCCFVWISIPSPLPQRCTINFIKHYYYTHTHTHTQAHIHKKNSIACTVVQSWNKCCDNASLYHMPVLCLQPSQIWLSTIVFVLFYCNFFSFSFLGGGLLSNLAGLDALLIDWLICWLIVMLVGGWLTDWLTDRPTDWSAGRPTDWSTNWLVDWFVD